MKTDELPTDIFDLSLNTLDKHCLEQAKLVFQYGTQFADAKDKLERAKAQLDVIKAETADKIRQEYIDKALPKPTVDVVKNATETNEEVLQTLQRMHKRKHTVDILQAMMNALEHRKRMIEKLVDLFGQQYFAEPRLKQEAQEAMNERTRKSIRNKRSKGE